MKLKRIFKWTAIVILFALVLVVALITVAYWRSDNDCGKAAAPTHPMNAIVYCDYGAPDRLHLEPIEKPVPNENQVLIKVRAASINPLDWHFLLGTPYIMRPEVGLRKPKSRRLGADVAGEVEAVGAKVTQFKPGDAVFGTCQGSFAQYCLGRANLAAKPANATFAEAASLPIAAITALQGLRDKGHLQAGQQVLINGASGGVGTFAVQIAKSLGAHVTGVCSGHSAALVRSLGADHVVDYTREDFTKSNERYDLILDCVGTQPLLSFKRVLKPNGRCVLIGGGGPDEGNWIGPMARPIKALLLKPFVRQDFGMLMAEMNHNDLAFLGNLVAAGKLKPIIDRQYALAETPAAIRYLEQGHAHGKVIINVDNADSK